MLSLVNDLQRGKWLSDSTNRGTVSVYTYIVQVICSRGIPGSVWQNNEGKRRAVKGLWVSLIEFYQFTKQTGICILTTF